jgi:Holliday junction resolvase-like predicted endonuclease
MIALRLPGWRIVARRGATVAFIEVKQRPALANCHVRFDVMALGGGLVPRRIVDAWRPE